MLSLNFFTFSLWVLRKIFAINFFFLWLIFRHYCFVVFFKWNDVEIFKICWYKRRRLWIFAHACLHSSIHSNFDYLMIIVLNIIIFIAWSIVVIMFLIISSISFLSINRFEFKFKLNFLNLISKVLFNLFKFILFQQSESFLKASMILRSSFVDIK